MPAYSQRYEQALRLAAQAHATQVRKGTPIPYITHVVHVAHILERHGFGEELVLAGLLHDVVEDSDISLDVIRAQFGDGVAELVTAVTEHKQEGGAERPWEVRKAESLTKLERASPDAAALKAADALHNAHSTIADLRESGDAVWQRFKRGFAPSIWYYREIDRVVQARLGRHPLALELAEAVRVLSSFEPDPAAQPVQGGLV